MLKNKTVILLLLLWLVNISQTTLSDEDAYVIGLFPEPVYASVNSSGSFKNEQTIRLVITNRDSSANDVGLHVFLPDDAELTSFSMNTEGATYKGKKVDHQTAQKILERAKSEDHNAAVYTPRAIPAVEKQTAVQVESTSVHIKAEKQMTFDLNYVESVADKIAAGKKILNRAAVVLDLYGATAERLVGGIYSPNYPQAYPNSADISWWLRAPDGKTIKLDILDLDIEDCCDRLTIYDGISRNGVVLAVLSGNLQNTTSTTIHSSTSSMFLHLTSDCSFSFRGFAAQVSLVGGNSPPTDSPPPSFTSATSPATINITACNGGDYLYDYSGYIYSPNYPNFYYNNLACSWRIQSPYSGYVIRLEALAFTLEQNYDFLYIYDGPSSYYNLLDRWTGYSHTGDVLYSSSYHMFLQLSTDYTGTTQGFQLMFSGSYPPTNGTSDHNDITTPQYSTQTTDGPDYSGSGDVSACNGGDYIYSYSGYIYSPNYPNHYDNDLSCTWQIELPYYYYNIKLTINHFSLESNYDYLDFYDGPSDNYSRIAHWTGYLTGGVVYSSSNKMFVRFTTDHSGTYNGFELYFTYNY